MRIARYGNTRYWAVLDADGSLAIPQKSPCRPKLLEFGSLETCS